eukprot:COSAG02_NODE_6830_length_3339_cov_30.941667_2_plen_68_part_00
MLEASGPLPSHRWETAILIDVLGLVRDSTGRDACSKQGPKDALQRRVWSECEIVLARILSCDPWEDH